jgi:hypothetical protein
MRDAVTGAWVIHWYTWLAFFGLALGLAVSGLAKESWTRGTIAGLAFGIAVLLLTGVPPAWQDAAAVSAKAGLSPAIGTFVGLLYAHAVKFAWVIAFCVIIGAAVGLVGSTPLRAGLAGFAVGIVTVIGANMTMPEPPCLPDAKGLEILRAYDLTCQARIIRTCLAQNGGDRSKCGL